jgi:hypothetical protein
MANIDYSIIVNMLSNVMIVAFPIALIFMIVGKITNIFISFVFGKEVNL